MRLIAKFSLLATLVGATLAITSPVTAGGYHLEYRFKGRRKIGGHNTYLAVILRRPQN